MLRARLVGMVERVPLASRRRIFVIYGLALIIGTHTPRLNFGRGFVISADKLLHVIAFMGLAILMMGAVFVRGARSPFDTRNIWWCALWAMLWGAITEVTQQQFVAGRSAHPLDILCNVIGVSAAVALMFILRSGAKKLSSAEE